METNNKKKKIAILGGGVGSMGVAWHLSHVPNWQEMFDITVYQVGWRLGGKGASGRNRQFANRIEEHGLHVWYGFYENAFKLMQDCYEELDRPLGTPLATWNEAFKPLYTHTYQEHVNGEWLNWPFQMAQNDAVPGTGGEFPSLWDYIGMALQDMVTAVRGFHHDGQESTSDKLAMTALKALPWWRKLLKEIEEEVEEAAVGLGVLLLIAAAKIAKFPEQYIPDEHHHSIVRYLLDKFGDWLRDKADERLDHDTALRRTYILLNVAASTVVGLLEDVLIPGKTLNDLDDSDFWTWLESHGGDPKFSKSFIIRTVYDQPFAYEDGDIRKPNFSTAVVIHNAFRVYFTYKGSFLWRMQAGMGDTIFGPLYLALKERGVKFEFFHRVEKLHLSSDGQNIERITMTKQVTMTPETIAQGGYNPLFDVKGLPCWPSKPLFEQIENGDQFEKDGVDLESFWDDHSARTWDLLQGEDFDWVVNGISLGAQPFIAEQLVKAKPDTWGQMVDKVKTTETQAFQVWLKPDLAGLGWPLWMLQIPLIIGYDPSDDPHVGGVSGGTADMSNLIIRESWPDNHYPNDITYFCGAILSPTLAELGKMKANYPAQKYAQAKANALLYLEKYAAHFWPDAIQKGGTVIDWSLLVDMANKSGKSRFDTQYWTVSVNPSDRYVLSVAGSGRFRLEAGKSGCDNLFLTGDWVKNPLNSGCVEAATMASMLAANAIFEKVDLPPLTIIGGDGM